MASARTIAAAQTIPVRGDVAANLEEHLRLVRAAAAEAEPHVLVFPELSLTGYELDLAEALAFSEEDPRLAPLAEAAVAHRMILVAGAPVRIETRLHIGAFVLTPDGSVALYTKRRLGAFPASASPDGLVPPAEAAVFQPGARDPLVRFGENRAAVAVCADTGDAAHPRTAAERGAATYLASMFLIPSDLEKKVPVLRSYAARHGMAVVMANYGGPSGGLPSGGGSAIWSERGEPLARLETAGSGFTWAAEETSGWRARSVMLGGAR
ncbi:MAG TPA: carbon-nitrogen hydrolase family protein [Acidobacteriota bacterium]|nr:carbon-nitrogen hydrolase family protein [Acidobacteriota bacterium]